MAVKKKFPYRAAVVACNGGCRSTHCAYGCIGCEACVNACKFGAIALNEYGVAEVNEEKCIACGACSRVCPRGIIHIHECAAPIVVKCANQEAGKDARESCEYSCIACGMCERNCPSGAIRVQDHCAVIEESLCLSCGACAAACPRHAIRDLRGIVMPVR